MNISVDNSVINQMAIQFAIILLVMLVVGFAIGLILKVTKAPQWLFKPFVTLGFLVGMYFIFRFIG